MASDPAHYRVEVNGVRGAIESASYSANGYVVTLALPEGSLQPGADVKVFWTGILDTIARPTSAGTVQVVVR